MTTPGTASNASGQNRGSNQLGVRQYNERLILQLIRRAGSLPKAEIARMTRLSPQTVSVIINRLLRDGLLHKQSRQREKGKVGQPSVPISLNPHGAYSIGIKLGRRSIDVLMIDFLGKVLQRQQRRYEYPDPNQVFDFIREAIQTLSSTLSSTNRKRIVGIGVAAPYAIGGWRQSTNAPRQVLERWQEIDIRQQLATLNTLPVWFSNDADAACLAELVFGNTPQHRTFLYVFVGTFIGGGLVINGALYGGSFGNAGALGSLPVPSSYADDDPHRGNSTVQLIDCASRYLLDRRLQAMQLDPDQALAQSAHSGAVRDAILAWQQQAATAIAHAIVSAISIIDFEGVIIDGMLPAPVIEELTGAVDHALGQFNLEGLVRPSLQAGKLGNDARALGGAILPLYANFAPDPDILLKMGLHGD